jgi:LuxR family maltose regulon positive regulatory protein
MTCAGFGGSLQLQRRVSPDQPFVIATLSNCLGYGYFIRRDFARCQAAAVQAHECGHRAGAAYLSAWGDFLHGLADVELGRLKEAALFGRGVQKDSQGIGLGQRSYVAGLSALLDAEIAVQQCDFDRARESIEIGRALKEKIRPAEPQLVAIRNEARLFAYCGQLDEARIVLQEGQDAALREQHLRLHFALTIEETSLQLSLGDVAGASETARKWQLRAAATQIPLRPGLTKAQRDALRLLDARFCIAEEKYDAALRALTLLQQARDAESRGGFFLSVTVHRALALWGQGKFREAARQLDMALEGAAAEFHVWPFLSAGHGLTPILDAIGKRRVESNEAPADLYQRNTVRDWLSKWLRGERHSNRPGVVGVAEPAMAASTVEPLTARELKLLRLLQSGLDNRRLADALLLSESTVKWHLHNVYGKLSVKSRGEAVAKSMKLGLI